MGFFDKIRASVSRFMSGRYGGSDQLNMTLIWSALILTIVGSIARVGILSLVSNVMLIYALFRIFSKNRYKRENENRVYLEKTYRIRQSITEWMNRVKNSKKYKYFTCPQCKKRLRVPRGVGQITITCKSCGNKFDKKA